MNIKVDMSEVEAGLKKYSDKTKNGTQKALRDTIVNITDDVINIHPWKTQTGNNSRSIKFEIKTGG